MNAVRIAPAVAAGADRPLVALETSVLAQGLPIPANREAAERMVHAIELAGAAPAFTAIVRGSPTLGLTSDELERFLQRRGVAKVSARDLGVAMAAGIDGATTVAASLAICRAAGVSVFATGGIGGVHHEPPFDESADLVELARAPVVVVCAGAKAILDVPATIERLETLGVTVVGYRTSHFPGFFFQATDVSLAHRVEHPAEVAAIYRAQRAIGHPSALLVVQPPPPAEALDRAEVEQAVSAARQRARAEGIRGAKVTPFLLASVEAATAGRSRSVNLSLLEANASLAAAIAAQLGATLRPLPA